MENGPQNARERLLEAVCSGDWERVPAAVDAYGAAVRADERRRAIDGAIEAVESVFGDDAAERSAAEWRDACVAALERLY